MSNDMDADVFAKQSYGILALERLKPKSANFRLYAAKWLGATPADWQVLEVTGAEFRRVASGRNKGKLTIMVAGTKRSTHVTKQEIAALNR